jgi:hypothetical protein
VEIDLEPKALYNFLRMRWEQDPNMGIEPWQVEDYRSWSAQELFQELQHLGVSVDENSFIFAAKECDTPEELTSTLLEKEAPCEEVSSSENRVYLLIFELWRKFFPERQSLSLFCDELDYRLQAYHQNPVDHSEAIQDAIANLQEILETNNDEGGAPQELFQLLCRHCGNDVEQFLYDFIAEEINAGNDRYATDLIEGFSFYVFDRRWFDCLKIRLWLHEDLPQARTALEELLEELKEDSDLDLYLELLDILCESGLQEKFPLVAQKALPLLETEEDFQDLLYFLKRYCHSMNFHEASSALERLQNRQKGKELHAPFKAEMSDLQTLQEIFSSLKS